ncbi:MAG: hypothetical protein JWN48_3188 [Myxococcaceae bacterium]|nr:hypothetical protein [Myxococcaceae bacterium]
MKATTLLEQQHRKVKAIFKKLESKSLLKKLMTGESDPAALVQDLANDLIAHMAIEHEIFYPAVAEIDHDLVGESFEEHALAEIALKRLLQTDPSADAFAARVTACKELIEHHVQEEEEELFPKVEKKLGDERLEELGKAMKKRFAEVKEAGFVDSAPKGFGRTLADSERKLALGRTKKRAA